MKNWLWFLIMTFFCLSFDRLNVFKYCIISSLLHELGHITAYRLFTGTYPQIQVTAFGFSMKNNVTHNKYFPLIVFAGPMVNLVLVLMSGLILQNSFSLNVYIFMLVNTIIFVMNIIPVYYLDGGQLLYSKSRVYQRFYRQISGFFVIFISVMVYCFTDNLIGFIVFLLYFAINISNDV